MQIKYAATILSEYVKIIVMLDYSGNNLLQSDEIGELSGCFDLLFRAVNYRDNLTRLKL